MSPKLSVIIPVFDEPNIKQNLLIVDHELSHTHLPYEIIVVIDGAGHQTTDQLETLTLPYLKVFDYHQNQGKGFALRFGFEQSVGELVCFLDADLELHPSQISLFINLMDLLKTDAVIGSKRHSLSQVEYDPYRRFYSWGFQQIIKILFKLNVRDTQVGLKLFRRQVLEAVMPRLVIKAWAFDLELLVVAHYLGFNRIAEGPINLTWRGNSHINWKVIPPILQDTLAIYYRKNLLHYYDHPQKESFNHLKVTVNQPPAPETFTPTGVIFSAN